jgi:hypothetical protein
VDILGRRRVRRVNYNYFNWDLSEGLLRLRDSSFWEKRARKRKEMEREKRNTYAQEAA